MIISQYAEMLAIRQKLPAFAAKENFLKSLEAHRVVIVVGETGCGKTTQRTFIFSDDLN